jgi:diguanylate cyclase (GGDEF)-like protein/PAS domain S-box-containing protein
VSTPADDFRALEAVPVGIQVLEAAGDRPEDLVLVWANAEASRHSGFDLAALAPARVLDIFPGESPWLATIFRACAAQAAAEVELPYADERVGEAWWRARVRPLGGRRALAAFENLTAERALMASERLNRAIVGSLREGIVVVDLERRIVLANRAAAALCRMDAEEVRGARLDELPISILDRSGRPFRPDDFPQSRALRGETVAGVLTQVVQRDGTSQWVEVDAVPLAEDGAAGPYGAVSTYRDVTARTERERRIRQEADTDPLTGLANRRRLERTLSAAVARAQGHERRVAVLMLDLDGFKAVNDRLGHAAGDATLREVGGRLRGVVRERDLVARVGGDEFVIVLTDVGGRSGATVDCRERVTAALAQPLEVEGEPVHLSAAVGTATSPDDGTDGAALLAHADRAMYANKRGGPEAPGTVPS